MKKNSYLLLANILALFSLNSYSQSWSAVGSGVNGTIYCMAVYDSAVYVGGSFTSAGGQPALNIAKWDGTNWSALGSGIKGTVQALTVGNGKLYVGGNFDTAGNIKTNNLATWNDSNWDTVSNTYPVESWGGINNLVWCDSLLYTAAFRYGKYSQALMVTKWNGKTWTSYNLGTDMYGLVNMTFCDEWENTAIIYSLATYNNQFIIGGNYTAFSDSGKNCGASISAWDVTGPSNMAGGFPTTNPFSSASYPYYFPDGYALSVNTLYSFNGKLYAGGTLQESGGMNLIAEWDGSSWSALGGGFNLGQGNTVNSITSYNGSLIAGGVFNYGYSVNQYDENTVNIAKWNGTGWYPLGSGVPGIVKCMVTFNGQLYVGGEFNQAGGISVNNVAIWSESAPAKTNTVNESAVLYPNPNKGTFYITANDYPIGSYVEIYNAFGQRTGSYTLNAGGLSEINLAGTSVSGGVYLYRISSEGGDLLSSGRFIVL